MLADVDVLVLRHLRLALQALLLHRDGRRLAQRLDHFIGLWLRVGDDFAQVAGQHASERRDGLMLELREVGFQLLHRRRFGRVLVPQGTQRIGLLRELLQRQLHVAIFLDRRNAVPHRDRNSPCRRLGGVALQELRIPSPLRHVEPQLRRHVATLDAQSTHRCRGDYGTVRRAYPVRAQRIFRLLQRVLGFVVLIAQYRRELLKLAALHVAFDGDDPRGNVIEGRRRVGCTRPFQL